MTDGIYRLDDGGAIFHIAADSREEARNKWADYLEGDVSEEPEVTRVQLTEAVGVMVTDDELRTQCSKCGTLDALPAERSLLEVWQEDNKLPAEKRAKHGILCCSEWP